MSKYMTREDYKKTQYNTPFIEQRADPYVYRHKDGYYYFTASVPEYDRIVLRRAKTMEGLKVAKENVVWHKHDTGIMSRNIWAPEIHYIAGKWYIYFAAGEMNDLWKIRPYILECESENPIDGVWLEKGKMQGADNDAFSFEAFSLDATVFEHRGECYCVWAEKVGVGKMISNIYIAQMENPCKLKTQQVLLTTPDYEWEREGFWVNEGPAVLKRNGKIFLTYSASATGTCYCMGMLLADGNSNLLDPLSWRKSKNPIVSTDEDKGIFGPGHNSFTVSEGGDDVMVYHSRQYDVITGNPLFDPNRHAMVMAIEWDKNGMPIFEYKNNRSY